MCFRRTQKVSIKFTIRVSHPLREGLSTHAASCTTQEIPLSPSDECVTCTDRKWCFSWLELNSSLGGLQTALEFTKMETSTCFPSLMLPSASISKHAIFAYSSKRARYFATTVRDKVNFWHSQSLASVTFFLVKCLPVVPAKKTHH